MRDNQASSTALLIAACLSYLHSTGAASSPVPLQSRLVGDWLLKSYSSLTRGLLTCLDQCWFGPLVRGLEALTLPHIMEHYAARKRALECLVRQQGPARQLIVLGAGFDTMGLRLAAEFPQMRVFEIDHPATQIWKTKAVAACQLQSQGLTFVPHDLSQVTGFDFLQPVYRQDENAFWVAEGLLMYFSAQRVAELFRRIHEASAPGSRIAFTFMEPQADGRVDFRRSSRSVQLWLSRQREPFAWGIRREDLPRFLSDLGFRLLDLSPEITREVSRLNVGEYLALAEVR